MIEINLVPDVKQELIKAQRVRASVISVAIIIGFISVGVVVLLGIWVFGVQAARNALTDSSIQSESEKLAAVEDVSNTLTIQNQLSKLTQLHADKHVNSRLFDILTTINPPEPNTVAITKLSLDTEASIVRVEAQAANGYPALEVFKKTIAATTLEFTEDGETRSVPLANTISESDRSLGESATGAKVLRFTLSFTYSEELFSRSVQNASIIAPTQRNVTDSFLGVPQSLFTERAADTEGN